MTKKRPILGYGGDLYRNQYRLLDQNKKVARQLGLTVKRNVHHPHSTFFNLLYLGGIPALTLFITLLFLLVRKMNSLTCRENNSNFPWAIASLALIAGILVYGTSSDVLTARRDVAVVVWCFFGIMAVLPEIRLSENEVDNR
jgi:O-antigen ligase